MNIYICMIVFILSATFLTNTKNFLKSRDLQIFFAALFLIIFAGMRYEIGYDYISYQNIFNNAPYLWEFRMNDIELGYAILNSLIKTLGFGFNSVLFIMAMISIVFLTKSAYKYSYYPMLVIAVYVTRFYFVRDMGQIRSAVACMILLYSIQYIKQKKIKMFIIYVFIASLFHTTAIIFLVLYFIGNVKNEKYIYLLIIVASLFRVVGGVDIVLNSVVNILPQYKDYIIAGYYRESLFAINPIFIMQITILFILLKKKNILQHYKYYHILVNGYVISILFLILFSDYYTLAGRLSTIFGTLEILIIPLIFYAYTNYKAKYLNYCILFVYLALVFSLVFIAKSSSVFIPYQTIFTN